MSASFRDDPQALWPEIIIVLKGTCMLVFKELTGDTQCLLRGSQQVLTPFTTTGNTYGGD